MIRWVACAIGGLIDILIPPTCCICRALLDRTDIMVCPDCLEMFIPMPLLGSNPCHACQKSTGLDMQIRAPLVFGGACKDAILALKMGGKTQLAPFLADRIANTDLQGVNIRDCDLLVPIPLHKSCLARRGFNQAALLARSLSALLEVPVVARHLVKHQATPSQHSVESRKERLQNVKGSFRVSRNHPFYKKKCCLVDDVVTTGATLNACAEVLYEAGATSVMGVAVAQALSG